MLSARVEVFKTNVQTETQTRELLLILNKTFPSLKINFDLDDCDKILRVEGDGISFKFVIKTLKEDGFQCQILV